MKMTAKRPKWIFVVATLFVLVAGLFIVRARLYVYAIIWHCLHGNYAQVGGYKMKLPIWWWEERDPNRYDTWLLLRASANTLLRDEIDISPVIPGGIRESDDAQREAVENSISQANHDALSERSWSLVTLKTRRANLYCQKLDSTLSNISFYTNVSCTAARSKYVFSYNGLSTGQSEAITILSSLE
jgi:hypothetical protein